MTKIKMWICEKYLPSYAKESMKEELRSLNLEVDDLRRENERLRAYIAGLERGVRSLKKIVINTEGNK